MNLTAAASGFVVFLLVVQGVQSQNGWRVTYNPTNICALNGTTVELSCIYTSTINREYTVDESFWSTKVSKRELKCHSSCPQPHHYFYVWYKNGQEMPEAKDSSYSGNFLLEDSYTCALKGYEDFPSPPVCGNGKACNRVTYSFRTICASKGSSVAIPCTYNSYGKIISKLWFSPGFRHHWQYFIPEDLSRDPKYAGRFQVYDNGRGQTTLSISALNESDSAHYRFKFTSERIEWGSAVHGTTLTVTALQVQVTRITAHQSYTKAELRCHSSCNEAGRLSYGWFRNREKITSQDKSSYEGYFSLEDEISCALKGHDGFPSPSVHAPKVTSVLLNPPDEILENNSVTLTCSTDANPAANYTWYKKNGNSDFQPFSEELQLVYSSIQSSDSGEYYCTAENELGRRKSGHVIINVKYAPKPPSVSVIPLDEVMEGSSVTLTCKSDANPAATNTWYKGKSLFQGKEGIYSFTSIKSNDSGIYFCISENKYGQRNSSRFIDVQCKYNKSPNHINTSYAPRLPTVSSSPSVEIMEGSMVNLTCSSDANPAAKYTWYKINENTPIATGQIFTINDIGSEHSSMTSVTVGSVTAIFLVIIFLFIFLLIRRKMSSKETNKPGERPDSKGQLNMDSVSENLSASAHRQPVEEQKDLYYASVGFSKNNEDPLYSNILQDKPNRPTNKEEEDEDEDEEEDEDDVEYTMVNFNSASAISGLRCQEVVEYSSALYSTITKKPRVPTQ
ncbi:B-cell receptor CD22-like [Tautogolabrus adspersus]